MKINFVINNYILIWNLLYGPSISLKTHAYKQKLWLIYKNEYKIIEKDNVKIIKDFKNFIPDNNTLYDLIDGSPLYEKLENDANKNRINLMSSWDQYRTSINKILKNIVRFDLDNYNVIVLPYYMDTCIKKEGINTICWGFKKDKEEKIESLIKIIYTLLKNNIKKYDDELDNNIASAILELAIINEMTTLLTGVSHGISGTKDLYDLKKEIYPYFLMYLGVDLEDTASYMMRDKLAFDIEKYTNEVQLRKLDLNQFIDFVVRNKTRMLKLKKIGLEIL